MTLQKEKPVGEERGSPLENGSHQITPASKAIGGSIVSVRGRGLSQVMKREKFLTEGNDDHDDIVPYSSKRSVGHKVTLVDRINAEDKFTIQVKLAMK